MRVGVLGSLVWDVIHGRDLAAAPGRGVGRHRLRAGRLRGRAAGRLGARAADQGGQRPPRRSGDPAPRPPAPGARRPVRRGTGAEQSRDPPLSVGRPADRADERRCAGLDLGRAGADGPRPRRDLRQLHLRIRTATGHGAGAAPGLSRPDLRRPAQPASSACRRTASGCCVRWSTSRPGSACFDVVQLNEDEMRADSPPTRWRSPCRRSPRASGC